MIREKEGSARPLRAWHGLLFFFVAFALQFLVVVFFSVAESLGWLGETHQQVVDAILSPESIGLQVIFTTSMLTAIALLAPRLFKLTSTELLKLGSAEWAVFAAAVIGVIGLGFAVDQVTYILHSVWPGFFSVDGLLAFNQAFAEAPTAAFLLTTVAVSAGPGIGEELFFRGLLLRIFIRGMPIWLAVLLSSALFGVMHLDRLQGTGAALIGAYLGFVALRAGSIWPAVLAHAVNNAVCALFARYDAPSTAAIWDSGHPPWLQVAACAMVAFAVVAIWQLTKPRSLEESLGPDQ